MKIDFKIDLCANCIYSGKCIVEKEKKTPIHYCQEHQTVDKIESRSNISMTSYLYDEEIKGLCGHCDLRSYCSLRSKDVIILNCEHYQ